MIIDAHLHIGETGTFFIPQTTAEQLLAAMDRLGIDAAVCMDHRSLFEGCVDTLPTLREVFERSNGRIFYLGVFHPGRSEECLLALEQALKWPGFRGIKLHPSFHSTSADDAAYESAWRFADKYNLPILTHSWSASPTNASQIFSTPKRFESYVKEYSNVRLVLGHSGGRGKEQADAWRMAAEFPGVYLDFAGDVFCYRLLEKMLEKVPAEKVLFGSDYPWIDVRANFARVLLSGISDDDKQLILGENARKLFRIEV